MCESAMMSKAEDGPLMLAKHVEIGRFGSQRDGRGGQSGLSVQAGAAQTCARQEVGYRLQVMFLTQEEVIAVAAPVS